MDLDTAARVRRAHTIRLWAGGVVIVVGLIFAFGNPLWGGMNTTLEIVLGLLMVAAGVLNIVLSLIGLRRLPKR
jgi:drug/metabolite transporter (DMT)-like permease